MNFKSRTLSSALTLAAALTLGAGGFAKAVPIVEGDLGVNPTSSTSALILNRSVANQAFDDAWTFTLSNSVLFDTSASVTNTFSNSSAFIDNFTMDVVSYGADGIFGTPDDTIVLGPDAASTCLPKTQCLSLDGVLAAGKYYLELKGNGRERSGYHGDIDVFPVPGPAVGAGLPGLVAACSALLLLARRRREKIAPV